MVAAVGLQQVVVEVLDGQLGLDAVQGYGFQLEHDPQVVTIPRGNLVARPVSFLVIVGTVGLEPTNVRRFKRPADAN